MKALRAKLRLSAAEELENVAVVNRHTYAGPQDNSYIYIGRGTPLGNPWSYLDGTAAKYKVDTREEAVRRFNDWFSEQIDKGDGPVFKFIHELKDRIALGEQIKLACSCVPKLCHGDVVKATIELLIHNERHPTQTLSREPLQLNLSTQSPENVKPNAPVIERAQTPALSARAEQAQSEVLAIDSITDDLSALYNVPEGLTRAEHASRLNTLDQFARDAFERGATLTENVLSIPRDPDARPRDETKVTIGTEAHAIKFVRDFIDDPKVAEEKGKLLFDIANKACGQWMDSDGRLTVFNHIYTEIRQDESGAYRNNEEKAEVIDQVLEETAQWAQPLPKPLPDPTPEQVHDYTLALADENRAELEANLVPGVQTDLRAIQLEPEASLYFDHLNSSSYGLATLGELTGFSVDNNIEGNLTKDENQIYAEMYETAIAESVEYATPEGDHLGAERENTTSVMLDASFDRINLSALPPQLPDTVSVETRSDLFDRVLPTVDTQLERGATKTEILTPLYETNRELEQRELSTRVTETFARAGHDPRSIEPVSRADELNALSSLRILVRAEYVQATKGFSREAIQFAKENYRVNPDWLRSQRKLQKGEYQRIVTSQNDARTEWLRSHPGQQVPTRAEITTINNLERTGNQLNAAIAAINPSPVEHARTLDLIQSRLASASLRTETLLQNYEAAEQTAHELVTQAWQYAENVRSSNEFQQLKTDLQAECKQNSIDEREALIRGNNARLDAYREENYTQPFDYLPLAFDWQSWEDQQIAPYEQQHSKELSHDPPELKLSSPGSSQQQVSNYPELTADHRPEPPHAQIAQANHAAEREAIQTLSELLISPDIERQQAINNAQLASYRETCTHLTGQNIAGATEAREAFSAKLQGLDRASTQIDSTRTRFGLESEPQISTDLTPSPVFVSLSSNSNIRVPVDNPPEYQLLISTAEQFRLNTTTWSTLHNPHPLSGYSPERADVTRFVSNYIDFRLKDHTTQQLSFNPTFRDYSERLATARTPEEIIQTSSQIKLENYEIHQQLVAHRADPANVAAPARQPLTVMEMREVFLSTNPSTAASPAHRAEMRDILKLMAVFGKEKEERVKLLAEGKITPSPTLAKLLANLESRQTVRAVNHFYSSLRTPADQLLTKNSFDLHKAHARLPQYERDYLHTHAVAQRYQTLNAKEQRTHLTPEPVKTSAVPIQSSEASKTAFYREYYGRADWLEAKKIVTAANVQNGPNNLNRSTIVPELKDLEVQTINYVVNAFDQNRQEQVAEYLKSSPDEHLQTIGDMITVAADVKVASAAPDVKEIELQLPPSYTLAPDSVATIVNYTQNESDRAASAARLPAAELLELRQEAQAQAWRDMERNVVKDPTAILDAPATTLYQAHQLTKGIQHTAALQERARTAFQAVNTHAAACVNKVEQTLTQLTKTTNNQFRNSEQQQTTRELVKIALDPQLQQSRAELIKANAPEYNLIQQTITTADRERAMQLREYAANTRAEYLRAFPTLDRDQQSLKTQERPTIELPVASNAQTTVDRYTVARDELTRTALGDKVQEMIQQRSLPELSHEKISTLTVKDLIPPDIREQAFEQAREPAWQTLEPHELRDAVAGREVPEPLLMLADDVMDHVATAQTIELELDTAKTELSNFVAEQIALAEAPVREERAAPVYDEQFRETLNTLASDTSQPERSEAAHQILETLERAELDQATLLSQAETQQLDSVTANLILEANEAALARSQEVRDQPIAKTLEARTEVAQQTIAELKGPTLDRYAELRGNLETTQERFQSALQVVDAKYAQLDLARTELSNQLKVETFNEFSRPAAIDINAYIKDTVRNEGLAALFDQSRTNEHVQQLATAIIDTARNNGITLAATKHNAQQITEIASNLFNTLATGIERANSEHALTHQLTHQYEVTSYLNEQTYNQLVVAAPTGSNDHAAHASFDLTEQQRRREETDRQKQTISTNKLPDQSGRQPSASEVAKTQDIPPPTTSTSLTQVGSNAAQLGGSVEDLAAVLAL